MRRRILLLSGTAAAFIGVSAASAQTTASPGSTASDGTTANAAAATNGPAAADTVDPAGQSANSGGLQEIIVTAQKTASSVQKTPIALRVVSGDDLRTSNITDVNGLQRLAPDLGVTTDTIYTKLSLRGVTAESIAEGADAALTVNIDGEYINRPAALNASFFDLDRIEVLKGPQGTLYGRNSTAGAINIITRKPEDRFGGYVSAGYGNYNAWNVEGAINLPIADGLAFRVAGIHTQHDGYRNNSVDGGTAGRNDGNKTDAGRATLAYTGSTLSGFLQGEYVRSRSSAFAQYGVPITTSTPGVVQVPTVGGGSDFIPRNSSFNLPKHDFPLVTDGFTNIENISFRGSLRYAISDGLELSYVGGYLINKTGTYVPLSGTPNYLQFVSNQPNADSRDWSNELRLSYHGPRGLFVQGGAFYFHEKQVVTQSIQILNPPFGPPGSEYAYVNIFYRPFVNLDSTGLFLQGDVPIVDTLKLTGGVRWSRDEKHALYVNSGLGFVNPRFGLIFPSATDILAVTGRPGRCKEADSGNYQSLDQCYNHSEVNWLAGAEWTPGAGHLLYAKVSTGYRSGGFDNLTNVVVNGQTVGTFQPEKITSYEIGTKNRFLHNTVEFNVSAFHYDYTDLQIDNFINPTVGHATVNAGRARFNGVDTDFSAALTPNDQFRVTFNYLDAKFTKFNAFATGVNGGTAVLDLKGNRPPQAPKVTIAVGYDHTFDLGMAGSLRAGAYTRFKSDYHLTSYNYAADLQEAYTQTDLSITWMDSSRKYSVQAFVRNVENYVPITFAQFTAGPPINLYNYAFGSPRTLGVNLSAKF
ncbi:TonB-dependent receptor [Sphingomonas pokkalii]|uniref:TonB-dependent receptor n=1 Tax=Sphingomonas pokkalii TaxID=2175090 RepID=A0A2U0SC51_9SPHN|nr:TonB-dependent receptor [Sphingomonas pokkalii]PVX28900.1 TonB-dependent receptor [Sphingomonas pokkalii]